jgi:type II secretory pathway predicted ATPase ExeA/septal ring-binding cell division protein DamX
MFKEFYNLKSEPFGTHPDPDINFISSTHQEAWYFLLVGIHAQEPFLVLTGEYGMGKTLLCLRLFHELKKSEMFPVEYIPTPYEEYCGILRRIAFRLGVSSTSDDEGILQEIIFDFFRTDTRKTRFYLILDDAHELSTPTLTKLKQFSTFSHNGFFPIIMIFFAHPSFLKDLRNPALISLNQRIKRRYHLSCFNFNETKEYIFYRLLQSGASGIPAFSEESLNKIFQYSGGIPRMINNICDTCLLIGASRELTTISPDIVNTAIRMVQDDLEAAEVVAEAEAVSSNGTNSKQVAGTFIAISKDAQQGFSLHHGQRYVNKKRKLMLSAMIVTLIILSGFVFYRVFKNDFLTTKSSYLSMCWKDRTNLSDSLVPPPPSFEIGKDRIVSQQSNSLSEKGSVPVPALREELDDKHSSDTTDVTTQAISGSLEPAITPIQADTEMDILPDTNSEKASSLSNIPEQYYPFSIRCLSYRHPHQAAAAIAEIMQLGLPPYLVKVSSGNLNIWWHLYIGQYATKQEARNIIKKYKLSNAMIQRTDYACQIVAFSNETDILKIFHKLKQSGYFPYTFQKDKDSYLLYLGAYENKNEADNLCRKLQKKEINCHVVKR